MVRNPTANAGDASSIPGSGRSRGVGNGNPVQYSCLGNPMGRGAWQATVHGVRSHEGSFTLSQHDRVMMKSFTEHFLCNSYFSKCSWELTPSPAQAGILLPPFYRRHGKKRELARGHTGGVW